MDKTGKNKNGKSTDKYTVEVLLKAIKGSGAIVSTIAKRLGCAWTTAALWCDKFDETREALRDEREAILDIAEGTLIKAVQEGDVQSAKWILATVGKKRGYTEKSAIDVNLSGGITITDDIPK